MTSTGELVDGRYRLGPQLGQGGMAVVHEAEDTRLRRAVAVKLLRPELARDPAFRARFEHEARAAARLSHPNVVAVHDTGEYAGVPYIVMERLPGDTLADRLRPGPLPEREVVDVALDVLAALDAAHRAGIVHRDVKPANVLFTADGRAKVADFGIAKALTPGPSDHDHTSTNLIVGTPAYVAPERWAGAPASAASDVWSVGVLMRQAATGTRPFGTGTPIEVARAVTDTDPGPVSGVSTGVAAVIDRAMAKEPERRFASASEMAGALLAARARAEAGPGEETLVLAVPDRLAGPEPAVGFDDMILGPRPARRRWLAGAAAAAAVTALVAAVVGGGAPRKAPAGPSPARAAVPATVATTAPPTTAAPTTTSPPTTAPPAPQPPHGGHGGHPHGPGG